MATIGDENRTTSAAAPADPADESAMRRMSRAVGVAWGRRGRRHPDARLRDPRVDRHVGRLVVDSQANGVAAALACGTLTAETGFGVIVGLVAGVLVVLGALVSLFKRRGAAAA